MKSAKSKKITADLPDATQPALDLSQYMRQRQVLLTFEDPNFMIFAQQPSVQNTLHLDEYILNHLRTRFTQICYKDMYIESIQGILKRG
jgi:hypothetical protein